MEEYSCILNSDKNTLHLQNILKINKLKSLFLILTIIVSFNLSAQINDVYNNFYLHKIDSAGQRIYLGVNSTFSSNSVKTAFFNKILTKDYIDNATKQLNNITDKNYLISENTNVISYIIKPDSFASHTDVGFKFDIVNLNRITSLFSKDLYNIAFYGNKSYAGKTADFTDSYYKSLTYQKINFGLFKHASDTSNNDKITYYAGFSIINGQDYKMVYLNNSSLFTSETGEYIDFNMQMSYDYAKNGKTDFLENRGIGGAFNFNLTYENTKYNYFVNLSIEDLGLIRWNSYSYSTRVDSNMHFEGVEIANILDIDNYSAGNLTKDSLMSQITDNTKRYSFTTGLNEKINLSLSKSLLKNNLFTTVGIGYLYNTEQPIPVFYGRTNYKFNKIFAANIQVAYGGFTGFQYGLGVLLNFKEFCLYLGSNNPLGFVLTDLSYSQNIFLRAGFNF